MPFNRETLTDIYQRLVTRVNTSFTGADASLRFTPEGVIASIIAMSSHELRGFLNYIARQILPNTADAEHLERHGDLVSIYRKTTAFASGHITLTGVDNAVIPEGTLLQGVNNISYMLDSDVVIVNGTGTGIVVAQTAGVNANINVGAGLSLVSPLANIQTSAVVVDDGTGNGIVGGVDVESDEDLRTRVVARWKQTPHGGAEFDYVTWATEVLGVTRAWPYPAQYGAGTVGVTFVMDNKTDTIIPTEAEVALVQEHIEAVRPVTADVTVFAPSLVPVDMEIALNPNSIAVQAAVKAELNDLFLRRSEPGKSVLISHIREAISTAAGEFDHIVITPSADVDMTFGQIPTLGTITWSAL